MCGCFSSRCCSSNDDHDDEENDFREMRVKGRNCTDVFCFGLFAFFILTLLVIGAYGYTHGDFNKKYLFPMDIRNPSKSAWICVDQCPSKTFLTGKELYDYRKANGTDFCMYPKIRQKFNNKHISSNTGVCPTFPVFKSESILNRCIPSDLIEGAGGVLDNLIDFVNTFDFVRGVAQDLVLLWNEILFFSLFAQDLVLLWNEILFFSLCALGVSLLVVFLIRFFAPIVVYLIYAMVVTSGIGVSSLLWYLWYDASRKADLIEPTAAIPEGTTTARLSFEMNFDARTLLALAVVSTICSVFLSLIVWCLWPRGTLVIDLFKQAGKAVSKMPSLLFQPIITSLVLMLFLCYWGTVFAYLYTSADPYFHILNRINSDSPQDYDELPIIKYEIYPILRYMIWIHVFGLIWISEFIFASQRMVIAGAIACWYFAKDRNAIGSPCFQAIYMLFRYHLGSIAFGSLIITAVKLPRYIFMYIYAKMTGSKNFIIKYLLACVIGLLACVEKCLRYLHHNAYTVIAISGQSFCPASKTATNILLDNAVNVATINSVGDFVLFLAKSMVTFAVACFAGYSFHSNPKVNYWYISTVLCATIAYFIANCFVSVYEMIVDTLFLCYAEETAMVTRSNGSQHYADADFHDFMNTTLQRERNYRRVPAVENNEIEMRERYQPKAAA
uniref:Choline transporter-like protein n=1 Tax=Panagrolaimus sp. PS1159 TaxID=55785 RepID=A0AC35G3S0_9BILA